MPNLSEYAIFFCRMPETADCRAEFGSAVPPLKSLTGCFFPAAETAVPNAGRRRQWMKTAVPNAGRRRQWMITAVPNAASPIN